MNSLCGRQDIFKMKESYGKKIALHGNIDLAGVLAYGTPDEVSADVIQHLEKLSIGGGYVCASSHNITESVPVVFCHALQTPFNYTLFFSWLSSF